MPSDRKQFNVRMSDDTAARVERLIPIVNSAVGVQLSQAQFFALAVIALEEKHATQGGADTPPPPVASLEPVPEKPSPKKRGKK